MEEIKLDVQIRKEIGSRKIKSIRREDFVPAVVYGGGKRGPTVIKVDRRAYERIMKDHRGQSVVFHLNVLEGEKKLRDYSAIVKEEQHHPVMDTLMHLDFQRISLTEVIEVKVPIEIKGEAIGVKKDGGSLDQPLRELDVVCLPTDIPKRIEIDVSELNVGDSVHVRDLALPAGVKTNHDEEAIILSIVPPMKEEPEASPEEGELTEPEVTGEKKEGEKAPEEGKAEEAKAEEKSDKKPKE